MIKITCGTFGFRKGAVVIPLNKDSEPIELSKDLEKRLVEVDKIAEYVDAPKEDKPKSLDRAALIKEFKKLGLKGNPNSMKSEAILAAIKEAEEAPAEPEETEEVGEKNDDNLVPEGEESEEGKEADAAKDEKAADENEANTEDSEDGTPDLSGDGIAEE